MIDYGSVCSGIEAASVAWDGLGWKAAWFAEIEKFPAAVLAHRYPDVPNLGDMTKIAAGVRAGSIPAPAVMVGGTPCQAFSIAGLRKSLDDPRGQLTLSYVDLANAIDEKRTENGEQPAVHLWENVPGSLSTPDNAFGFFLAGMAGENEAFEPGPRPEHGKSGPGWRWNKSERKHVPKWPKSGCVYGRQRKLAWRLLDAQYFGVAQRRRRIFVVASARNDVDPAEILLEFDGMRRDSPPCRKTGKAVAALTASGVGVGGPDFAHAAAGHLVSECDNGLKSADCDGSYSPPVAFGGGNCSGALDVAACLTAKGQRNDFDVETFAVQSATGEVSHTLTAGGHDASEDGTGRGTPVVAFSSNGHGSFAEGVSALRAKSGADHESIAVSVVHGTQDPDVLNNLAHTIGRNQGQENAILAFSSKDHGQDVAEGLSPTLRAGSHAASHANAGAPPAVAYGFQTRIARNGRGDMGELCHTLNAESGEMGKGDAAPCVARCEEHAAFAENTRGEVRLFNGDGQITGALSAGGGKPGQGYPSVVTRCEVRRLTPKECERLQGFPDGWTLIPEKKRNALAADELAYLRLTHPDMPEEEAHRLAADGPRYKAIGNSMAVPVMRWIGDRIANQIMLVATTTPPEAPTKNSADTDGTIYGIPGNWIGRAPGSGGNATEPMIDIAPCLTAADRHGVAYVREAPAAKKKRAPARKVAEDKYPRSFLKWAGGKHSVLDEILAVMPAGKRLIEPFVGSGTVFINAGFKRNLLGDINPDLINLFNQLQGNPDAVINTAHQLEKGCLTNEAYVAMRDEFNGRQAHAVRHAALFLALMRTCFNGLCRYNLKGLFNVGWNKKAGTNYFPLDELQHFAGLQKEMTFVCTGFEDVIGQAGEGDVVFCDPPYEPMPDESGFTAYSGNAFTFDHQTRLVERLVAARKRGAKVVITNSSAPSVVDLYTRNGFRIMPLAARRSVSCKGDTRKTADDIIAVL
ncbi:Dam family site-specific DNA-(adenine-N6)-methyltransferase [Pantoea eucrina]|uniref:Dam family site-specific DNA-(adenine-N6)-methyltransferase n=1 Tax=Pantoea eucrina TaxID=472693 RepID=UPI0024B7E707|nr:Dam family site-specific DNA-(adenine-N6)-methyltransferase [Pantoea eucrina]MDJ0023647.1 Dam family site-specific DNA-(adenine-N6)-methyltransferase [Pantoea eucrina]